MLLDRKALLKPKEFKKEQVDLFDGDFVFVRQMSAFEREQFERSLVKTVKDGSGKVLSVEQDMTLFKAKLAVSTICDESGKLLLGMDDLENFAKSITAATLEKIVEVSQRLNKLTDNDKEATIKNLNAGQTDNSNSASVEKSE